MLDAIVIVISISIAMIIVKEQQQDDLSVIFQYFYRSPVVFLYMMRYCINNQYESRMQENFRMIINSMPIILISNEMECKSIQQVLQQQATMHVQCKGTLTQTISSLHAIIKAGISADTHKQITACIEQIKDVESKINYVEEGNSGFCDKSIYQLQSVSAFLIICTTDVTNYYSKYIEPIIEGNKSKSTLQKKNFWAKLTDVITKVKKEADNAAEKETEYKQLIKKNEQLLKIIQQTENKKTKGTKVEQQQKFIFKQFMKQLEDDNTRYLRQLNTLKQENRKLKQTIEQYEKGVNTNSNEQQNLLERIKQLEISIAVKNYEITNTSNIIIQNLKVKEDEKVKVVSQLNQQIKTINEKMIWYKEVASNMEAGINECLRIIYQQQGVNFNNSKSPIDNLLYAMTVLIDRKRYYKSETSQIKDDLNAFYNRIGKLNLQAQIKTLADVVNTIEQYEEQRKQLGAFLTQVDPKAQLIDFKKHPSDHVVVDYSKLSDHQRNSTIMAVLDECLSETNQLRIQDTTTIFATPQNEQYVLTQLTNYCRTNNNQINRFNLLFRGSQGGDITEALKKHPNILLLARMTFNDEVENFACYSSQSQCETRGMPQIDGLLISTCLKRSYPLIHNKQSIKQQNREYVVFGNDAIKIDKVNLKKIFININEDTGFDTKGESTFNLFGANENQIVVDDFEIYEVVFKQNKIVEKAPQPPQMVKSESKSNGSHRTGMMDTRRNSEIPKEEPLPMRNMSNKKMELEYNSMKQLQGQLKKRVQFLQKENEELHRRLDKYEPSNTPSGERQTLKPAASSNQLSRSSSNKSPVKLPQPESDVTGAQKRDQEIKQLQKRACIAEDQSKSKDSLLQQITLQKTNAEKRAQLLSKQLSQMKQIIEKLQRQNDKVRQQKQNIQNKLNEQNELMVKIKASQQQLKSLQSQINLLHTRKQAETTEYETKLQKLRSDYELELKQATLAIDDIELLNEIKSEYEMEKESLSRAKELVNFKCLTQEKQIVKLQKQLQRSKQNNQLQQQDKDYKKQMKQAQKINRLLEKECYTLRTIIQDICKRLRMKYINEQSNQHFGGIISSAQGSALFDKLTSLYSPAKVKTATIIFKHPLMSLDSCTHVLQGKSHLVFVVRLRSGMTVAMYSEQAVSGNAKKPIATGKGFIASLTNCQFFPKRTDIDNVPTASMKDSVLSFGASEIRLNLEAPGKAEFNVGFGSRNHSFETREDTTKVMTDGKTQEIEAYEIYQIRIEQNND